MGRGAKPKDVPVTREELERALRHVNASIAALRDEVLTLGAQVVTLTRHLERRGVASEDEVLEELPAALDEVRRADAEPDSLRAVLGACSVNKYEEESPPVPCTDLLDICHGRCCRLSFALATQDLNECEVRWDYVRPYAILQRASDGYCVHNDPETGKCRVYEHRPQPCRAFDCRDDPRIWDDYEKRVLAPETAVYDHAEMVPAGTEAAQEARADRAEERKAALAYERLCLVGLRGTLETSDED